MKKKAEMKAERENAAKGAEKEAKSPEGKGKEDRAGVLKAGRSKKEDRAGALRDSRSEKEDKAEFENGSKARARSWKVDFVMGIVIAAVGLPFFAVDYKIVGIVMVVIGAFCIVSGLCQKVAKGEKDR